MNQGAEQIQAGANLNAEEKEKTNNTGCCG